MQSIEKLPVKKLTQLPRYCRLISSQPQDVISDDLLFYK